MVINLKNKLWILGVIVLIITIACLIFFYTQKNKNNDLKYQADRASQNVTVNDLNSTLNSQSNKIENANQSDPLQNQTKEEIITSFSTKIYNKESERQNNIQITCNTLDSTIVRNDSTFSFCDTVGQSTSAKGYQEADIFDKDGNKQKGLGGGNCQVSTTLYNAVLQVPNLVVTERHEHSNSVPYISKGKDAAVAYGSYDFKFKNNTGYDIMIKTEANNTNVIITLIKI